MSKNCCCWHSSNVPLGRYVIQSVRRTGRARLSESLVKSTCSEGWDMNPTKTQTPAASVEPRGAPRSGAWQGAPSNVGDKLLRLGLLHPKGSTVPGSRRNAWVPRAAYPTLEDTAPSPMPGDAKRLQPWSGLRAGRTQQPSGSAALVALDAPATGRGSMKV